MNNRYPFINTPLPYGYDAMEPYIDTKTMELHHDRHLQTYIDNLNSALKGYPKLQKLSLEQLIKGAPALPQEIGSTINNNAGGVYNHRFYFDGLASQPQEMPVGWLGRAIDQTYVGMDGFVKELTKAALSVFGSGYGWLVSERTGALKITTTPNQNTPLTTGLCPILNIDVWEHAYYLKHHNKRADYMGDWLKVMNWEKANERYMECVKAK